MFPLISGLSAADGSLIDLKGIEEVWCSNMPEVSVLLENSGDESISEIILRFNFDEGDGPGGFIAWSGFLAVNEQVWIDLPAVQLSISPHSLLISIDSVNAQPDLVADNNQLFLQFTLYEQDSIEVFDPLPVCINSEAFLEASLDGFGVLNWYESALGFPELGFGNTLVTPSLSGDATFYLDQVKRLDLGPEDFMIGSAQFDQTGSDYLRFNAHLNFYLVSVDVFAQSAGQRNIELTDSSGTVLSTKVVDLESGNQRVDLGFGILRGENYRLQLSEGSGLIRNSNGANYPYEGGQICSIIGNSDGGNSTVYPYFYNWRIEYGRPCGRIPVDVAVLADTFTANFSADRDLIIVPGPTEVQFTDLSQNATNWVWTFGDGGTSMDQDPLHAFSGLGEYEVVLMATGPAGCTDVATDTVTVTFTTNTERPELFAERQIFPNPFRQKLTIMVKMKTANELSWKIADPSGRKIALGQLTASDTHVIQLDAASWPMGKLFLTLETEEGQWTTSIIHLE